jgi:hypothetical protein
VKGKIRVASLEWVPVASTCGAAWVHTGKSAGCAHASGAAASVGIEKNEAFWWAHQTLKVTKRTERVGTKASAQQNRVVERPLPT